VEVIDLLITVCMHSNSNSVMTFMMSLQGPSLQIGGAVHLIPDKLHHMVIFEPDGMLSSKTRC
jgi:hypothetical protein